ncbi:hypothetical protein L1F30_01070 [Simiduia sp. 21SJ11W-1]|uniref:hypothetical protein n=1 Tax=Simiduia sp. 21SJ11W-1 TaxID=2909669 RepID=UPI00209FF3DF|nr:hypothetical protein [Simiduia sp. 21SJ11W-1]UTA48147.1 hypothetical protein L1F30_01070 [Simiduia sp. 21SJ11W-1]
MAALELMKYLDKLSQAHSDTKSIDLKAPKKIKFTASSKISRYKLEQIHKLCLEAFSKFGWVTSDHIHNQCVFANTAAYKVISEVLGIKCYLTIGYTKAYGATINKSSLSELKSELKSPNIDNPLQMHVWVTLSDGTIIDWTTEAFLTHREGEIKDIKSCMLHIDPEKIKEISYHPILVGDDYLSKVGAFRVGSNNHQQ